MSLVIGVLSVQGDFKEHLESLYRYGVEGLEVRTKEDLKKVDALILPGGESTTIAKLLLSTGLDEEIRARSKKGMPVWGTCAGAILLAKSVISSVPLETTLGLIDIEAERNSYGRQAESFSTEIEFQGKKSEVFFIRAPRIKIMQNVKFKMKNDSRREQVRDSSARLEYEPQSEWKKNKARNDARVQILLKYKGDPVLVRSKNVLVSTFHSELGYRNVVLEYFLEMIPHGK